MSKSQQIVLESFDRDNFPHPHEAVHCQTTKAVPVCFLECKCGYSGLAHVVGGKPVCPAHLARVEQHNRESNQTLETAVASPNIDAIVAAAVAKALAQQKGGN